MGAATSKFLSINRKGTTYRALCEVMDGLWNGTLHLARGMSIRKNTPAAFVVKLDTGAFAIEYDAVAILNLPPLKLGQPFLIPPQRVFALELRRTRQALDLVAICAGARTVSVEEARRLARKNALPPGIHGAAALTVTDGVKPHEVQGGLPSLGKRR
ncbi:MAG TPA: hypothetical protein VHP37_15275 [Burkholderiales bacterium]|nr:hypothetical protein [Burkholderiales bacterium]